MNDTPDRPNAPTLRMSPSIANLAPSWVAMLNELSDVHRTNTASAGSYSYTYADLATIMRQIRIVASRYELGIFQTTHDYWTPAAGVTTTVVHATGEWITSGVTIVPTGKGGAQETGSAISYARRYSLLTFCGLATEDDDGSRAQQSHDEPPAKSDAELQTDALLARLKALDKDQAEAVKTWAHSLEQKLSPAALVADDRWRASVFTMLDEIEADRAG